MASRAHTPPQRRGLGLLRQRVIQHRARRGVLADEAAHAGVMDVIEHLYHCYIKGDADLVEINPLILAADGSVCALDAKVTLDDSAAFRHPEWREFVSLDDLDWRERLVCSRWGSRNVDMVVTGTERR